MPHDHDAVGVGGQRLAEVVQHLLGQPAGILLDQIGDAEGLRRGASAVGARQGGTVARVAAHLEIDHHAVAQHLLGGCRARQQNSAERCAHEQFSSHRCLLCSALARRLPCADPIPIPGATGDPARRISPDAALSPTPCQVLPGQPVTGIPRRCRLKVRNRSHGRNSLCLELRHGFNRSRSRHHGRVRRSTATPAPMIADKIEAANTAIFAAAKSAATGNAWPAMNSDMVKPIPASAPAPDQLPPGVFVRLDGDAAARPQAPTPTRARAACRPPGRA